MKKLTHTFNTTLMLAILFSTVSIQGMEWSVLELPTESNFCLASKDNRASLSSVMLSLAGSWGGILACEVGIPILGVPMMLYSIYQIVKFPEVKTEVIQEENQMQETSWFLQLPGEIINHIAGDCEPAEKDLLMKVCQSLHKRLQDKEAILLANPSTVTWSHKRKKMFEYAHSNDAKKLSIWLSVLEAASQAYYRQMFLHSASKNGCPEVVRSLLTQTNVNQVNDDGITPLYSASREGHIEVVRLLLDNGADVNQINKCLNMPLHIASQYGHAQVVQLLLNANGMGIDKSLRNASQYGHAQVVQLLLDAGADVNQTNSLHVAITSQNDCIEVIQLLLTQDEIDVNKADKYGYTPLHLAIEHGQAKIVQLLLNAGANIYQTITDNPARYPKSEKGYTALEFAQKRGNTEIVELIRRHESRCLIQ